MVIKTLIIQIIINGIAILPNSIFLIPYRDPVQQSLSLLKQHENFTKLQKIGWEPVANFDNELSKIVDWYRDNEEWWREEYDYIVEKTRSKRLDIK